MRALQFVGFHDVDACREYRLQARDGDAVHEYVVAIPRSAFSEGRVKLQDGPDVCYLRVQREIEAAGLGGPTRLAITDDDLQAYRASHAPAPRGRAKAAAPAVEPEGLKTV